MERKAFLTSFREHPIAVTFCIIYLLLGCWLAHIAYHDFTQHGDGVVIGLTLYYFTLVITLPYCIVATAFAIFSKTSKRLYWDMVSFVLAFIPAIAIIIFIFKLLIK